MIYTVKQGDHLSQIAFQHGFRNFRTIWDDPANADLKDLRRNPNVLMPGDMLVIPDKEERRELRPTGDQHVFVIPVPKLRLRIVFRNVNGDPLPNTDCELIVDGKKKMLKTGADGRIDEPLPVLAKGGAVIVAGEEYQLKIGDLDPVEEESGQRARLANLGYYLGSGSEIDEEELRSAIEEFQCDHDLFVDGVCGPKTQKKLLDVHGC
jgi:Putative peptidoglycan binding domain/LysM domain